MARRALALAVASLLILTLPGAGASDIANPASKAKRSSLYSPATAWDLGLAGRGVVIAVLDTGVDNQHPGLAGKWLGGADLSKPETFLTPRDGTFDADDTNGHGTTCSGIAMGTGAPDGIYQGSAPEARLVDIRIGSMIGYAPGEGPFKFYDASLQGERWALEHREDRWPSGGGEYTGIDILSLSWGIDVGGSSDGSDVYSKALDDLVEAGVIVVGAAGNDGPQNDGFTGMSASSLAISVGATDDNDTVDRSDDVMASYSSRGPRRDNGDGDPFDELKPDVCAPGTGIAQCEYDRTGDGSGQGYGPRGSGTSYATPLVAGIVALMLEANRNLTPALAKEMLRATAERRGEPSAPELDPFWNREHGWGMVDAGEACRMALRTTEAERVDVGLQAFVLNATVSGGQLRARGLSWNRYGSVERTEVRLDNGSWRAVRPDGGTPFGNWSASIDISGLSEGNHTLFIRSEAGGKRSLSTAKVFTVPAGQAGQRGPAPGALAGAAAAGGLLLAVAALVTWKRWRSRAPAGSPDGATSRPSP